MWLGLESSPMSYYNFDFEKLLPSHNATLGMKSQEMGAIFADAQQHTLS